MHNFAFFLSFFALFLGVATRCDSESKLVQEKYAKSNLVVSAQFRGFSPNATDPRLMRIANFRTEDIFKLAPEWEIQRGSSLSLPLYRGHPTFSRRTWCLADKMLRTDTSYVLFLGSAVDSQGKMQIHNEFLPEKFTQKLKRIIFPNANQRFFDGEEELPPVFELEIDLGKADTQRGPVKKAEIDSNSGIHLRCAVKGETHEVPELSWIYNGGSSKLTTSADGIHVETDHKRLVSNLKLSKEYAQRGGIYECSVRRKADGRYFTSKLKIIPKPVESSQTLFGEEFCRPEKADYCQHGGTCLFHPTTKVYSCRCTDEFVGRQCEYYLSGLHVITSTSPKPPTDSITEELRKSVGLVGGIAGFFIISLFVAFIIYVKKRDQIKNRSRRGQDAILKNGTKSAEDKERLIGQVENANFPSRNQIDWTKERLKILQSLIPARCPHCRRPLGITADQSESIRGHHSTPQLRRDQDNAMPSECPDCVNMNRNRSTPCAIGIDSSTDRTEPKKKQYRGVLESKLSSISSSRKSASNPGSPTTSLCQLHSAQFCQREASNQLNTQNDVDVGFSISKESSTKL